ARSASSATSSCRPRASLCRASTHGAELRVVPTTRKSDTRATAAVLPRRRLIVRPALVRFLPSGRSLLVGFGLIGLAATSYLAARETSMFAVRRIEVTGARPLVVQRVDRAMA